VGQVQALVEVGFRMATGTAEALRPTGLALQAALLRRFGSAADPLQPDARLLAQYQAQLVSSLRCPAAASPLLSFPAHDMSRRIRCRGILLCTGHSIRL
jgi:hypothetical protein